LPTFAEVEKFLEDFAEQEYQLHLVRGQLAGNRDDFDDQVEDFFDEKMLYNSESTFSALNRWPVRDSNEDREKYLKHILRRRKIFLIERFEGAVYDNFLKNENPAPTLFRSYVSDNSQIAQKRYFKRFYITAFDGILKLTAVDSITRDAGWKEIAEFPGILKTGELVEVTKIQPPSDEEDLEHYNSVYNFYN